MKGADGQRFGSNTLGSPGVGPQLLTQEAAELVPQEGRPIRSQHSGNSASCKQDINPGLWIVIGLGSSTKMRA